MFQIACLLLLRFCSPYFIIGGATLSALSAIVGSSQPQLAPSPVSAPLGLSRSQYFIKRAFGRLYSPEVVVIAIRRFCISQDVVCNAVF